MKFNQKTHLALSAIGLFAAQLASAQTSLLNVSYDVSREFYKDLNVAFVAHHKKTTGKDIKVDQSHAGSSAQARAVVWQRLMSCVVKPLKPHWFFNSSNPFSQSARSR